MSKVTYNHGTLKIEEDNKIHVLDFGERLMIKELINMYYKYDTKFKAEMSVALHKERKVLNVYINEHNAEDYYKAKIYDNRNSFVINLCKYMNIETNEANFTPSVMLTMLRTLEMNRDKMIKDALEVPIRYLDLYFNMCSEIARYIAEFLYKCGYKELPVSLEVFIELYYDIINNNRKIVKFVGSEHEEDYNNAIDLFTNTLTIEYIDSVKDYIKYSMEDDKDERLF